MNKPQKASFALGNCLKFDPRGVVLKCRSQVWRPKAATRYAIGEMTVVFLKSTDA